jgi:hypothetical protein
MYFDVNQRRMNTWSWQKLAPGRWSAVGNPTGNDVPSINALGQVGQSTRFGGTSPCPT